jgi:hypothetical protein
MSDPVYTHANNLDGSGPLCGAPDDEPRGGIVDCPECAAKMRERLFGRAS